MLERFHGQGRRGRQTCGAQVGDIFRRPIELGTRTHRQGPPAPAHRFVLGRPRPSSLERTASLCAKACDHKLQYDTLVIPVGPSCSGIPSPSKRKSTAARGRKPDRACLCLRRPAFECFREIPVRWSAPSCRPCRSLRRSWISRRAEELRIGGESSANIRHFASSVARYHREILPHRGQQP